MSANEREISNQEERVKARPCQLLFFCLRPNESNTPFARRPNHCLRGLKKTTLGKKKYSTKSIILNNTSKFPYAAVHEAFFIIIF